MLSFTGLLATSLRLAAEERNPPISLGISVCRPQRVTMMAPATAANTPITARRVLLDGSLKVLSSLLPDQAKKTTISITLTMPPATLLRPTAANAVVGSNPDFWRYRMLR